MSWREILGVEDPADSSSSQDLHKSSLQPNPESELEVAESLEPEAKLSMNEISRICAWLAYIQETDPVSIYEILSACRNNQRHREYYLMRAKEVPKSGSNS